jgi:hypothetical protein
MYRTSSRVVRSDDASKTVSSGSEEAAFEQARQIQQTLLPREMPRVAALDAVEDIDFFRSVADQIATGIDRIRMLRTLIWSDLVNSSGRCSGV